MLSVPEDSTESSLGGEPVGFEQLESRLGLIPLEATIPAQNEDRYKGDYRAH